jgi:hypothetical protein
VVQEALEHRRLRDAEADPQADADEYNRQRERNTPAPGDELVARPGAEGEDRQVRPLALTLLADRTLSDGVRQI